MFHAGPRSNRTDPICFRVRRCKRRPKPGFSLRGLVLHMLVVSITGNCLVFLCSHLVVGIFSFASTSQEVIGREDHLQDDLLCAEWDVKP